ncbi:MAG: acylneuraminate cytidylyltransferase family protein [Muribaculaceae bacterium]|nr:acylneuraminate cytidylyltransferase family protein [Muribaculaceae bacterium]
MNYLYLIPARGGSKGIPGKNIKPLAGVPLIGHSIRHALDAGAPVDDVVVTTDSEEIARVAREYGASVPFMRPAELASDTASSRDAILHAVDALHDAGRDYDAVVLLQPTSPFRRPDDIINAIHAYEEAAAKATSDDEMPGMAVSVAEARTNPYYSAFETDSDGFLHISKGDGLYTRRQDAPKVWEFNGAVYVINPSLLRLHEISRLPRIIPVEMPADRSLDLDSLSDWQRAEQKFNLL